MIVPVQVAGSLVFHRVNLAGVVLKLPSDRNGHVFPLMNSTLVDYNILS